MENVALGFILSKLITFLKDHPAIDFLMGFGFGLLVGRVIFS